MRLANLSLEGPLHLSPIGKFDAKFAGDAIYYTTTERDEPAIRHVKDSDFAVLNGLASVGWGTVLCRNVEPAEIQKGGPSQWLRNAKDDRTR